VRTGFDSRFTCRETASTGNIQIRSRTEHSYVMIINARSIGQVTFHSTAVGNRLLRSVSEFNREEKLEGQEMRGWQDGTRVSRGMYTQS
jgi:hypothetical protein